MTELGPPPNATEVMEHIDDALQGLELEPNETAEILGFVNQEVPHLQSPETSYFIFGSYRDPYVRRLRILQNELNKRFGTYPFLVGDLPELDVDRLPIFRIRFHVLATYADYIVAVFEQDAGGEVTELGKISETPYFDRSHVLPRNYDWMTDRRLDNEAAILAAAVNIYANDDLDHGEVEEEIEALASIAQNNGIELRKDEIVERIDELDDVEDAGVSYSWVHLNEFRFFELHDRCYPWATEPDLRDVVTELP